MSNNWRGIFAIVVTPFTDELELDEAALRRQIGFCIEAGAAGLVGPGNRTVYPVHDQTLLVKAVASSGAVGWGECFGVVAPQVAQTILEELLIPFVIGRSPHDVERIYEDLYDLQRVRGHFGGYALDAIAGLDIALWDLRGKLLGQPVWQILGGLRHERLPVYVSGLTVTPEDMAGQAQVARAVRTQIGLGEEWRTVYEYLPRLQAGCMNVIQPEIAHTGITGFRRICELAQAFHCRVMPHATINIGIAQAASLHVAATLANFVMQEYQHSIFDRNQQYLRSAMDCQDGYFALPQGPGLGTEPTEETLSFTIERN